MTYTLYVGENCHQCADIIHFLNEKKIDYTAVNVDLTDKPPPIKLFAFPALFGDESLICYGSDIKNYVLKNPDKFQTNWNN